MEQESMLWGTRSPGVNIKQRDTRVFTVLPEKLKSISQKLLFPSFHKIVVEENVLTELPGNVEFNTNFASLQNWFIHISHEDKLKFIISLLRSYIKHHEPEYLLEFFELFGSSKEFFYGNSQYTHYISDRNPMDENRSKTLGAMSHEAECNGFRWYQSLFEREQAAVIMILSRLGGSSLSFRTIVSALQLIEEDKKSKGIFKKNRSQETKRKILKKYFEKDADNRTTFEKQRKSRSDSRGENAALAKKEAEWEAMFSKLVEQSGLLSKESTFSQEKEERIDQLQVLPLSVNRKIYSFLDHRSKANMRSLNKYWKAMGSEIQREDNSRFWLNKVIKKLKMKTTSYKGRSWSFYYTNKNSEVKVLSSKSEDTNLPRKVSTSVGNRASYDSEDNGSPQLSRNFAEAKSSLERTSSMPAFKPVNFEMKSKTDFEISIKRKPSIKCPYFGRYTITKISERFDHDRILAANKQWIAISDGYDITLHSFLTGAPMVARLVGHSGCVSALVFHPSKSRIFSGSYDTTVRYWDVYSRTLIHEFCGHESVITSVTVNEVFLCSASMDGTIKVFDLANGVIMWSYECVTTPTVVALDKRQTLFAGSYVGHVEKILLSYYEDFNKNDVCPTEKPPTISLNEGDQDFKFDMFEDKNEPTLEDREGKARNKSESIRFFIEEDMGEELSDGSSSDKIRFAHDGEVTAVYVMSPLILTAGVDGVVHAWHQNYFDDGPIMTLYHKNRRVNSIAVSCMLILTASEDGKLRIWDIESKSLKREIVVNSSRRPIISIICLELFDHSKIICNNEDGIKILEFPFDWIKLRKFCTAKGVKVPPKQLTRILTTTPSDIFLKFQFKKQPTINIYSESRKKDLEVRIETSRDIQAIGPNHVASKSIPTLVKASREPHRILHFERYLLPSEDSINIQNKVPEEKKDPEHCFIHVPSKHVVVSKKDTIFYINPSKKIL